MNIMGDEVKEDKAWRNKFVSKVKTDTASSVATAFARAEEDRRRKRNMVPFIVAGAAILCLILAIILAFAFSDNGGNSVSFKIFDNVKTMKDITVGNSDGNKIAIQVPDNYYVSGDIVEDYLFDDSEESDEKYIEYKSLLSGEKIVSESSIFDNDYVFTNLALSKDPLNTVLTVDYYTDDSRAEVENFCTALEGQLVDIDSDAYCATDRNISFYKFNGTSTLSLTFNKSTKQSLKNEEIVEDLRSLIK